METLKDNDNLTPHSPEASYSSDSYDEPFQINTNQILQEEEEETSGSNYDLSFETIDSLVLEELLNPPSECDGSPEWPHDWPFPGRFWHDLNDVLKLDGEERVGENGEERGAEEREELVDDGEERGAEEREELVDGGEEPETGRNIIRSMSLRRTRRSMSLRRINEFEKDPKAFKPYGKSLLQKVEQVTGVKSTSMPSKFRRVLNPMIPSLDLDTDLHLSFMKKALTVIGEKDKKKLEERHCVTIKLNKKSQINSWKKEDASKVGKAQKGLVQYSDTSSSEEN